MDWRRLVVVIGKVGDIRNTKWKVREKAREREETPIRVCFVGLWGGVVELGVW